MKNSLSKLENFLIADKFLSSTVICYLAIAAIFANLTTVKSTVVGVVAAVIYFLINGAFLGTSFFADQSSLVKLTLGTLLLIMFLGLVGWIIVVIYVLDIVTVVLVLAIVATTSSILKKTVGVQ